MSSWKEAYLIKRIKGFFLERFVFYLEHMKYTFILYRRIFNTHGDITRLLTFELVNDFSLRLLPNIIHKSDITWAELKNDQTRYSQHH